MADGFRGQPRRARHVVERKRGVGEFHAAQILLVQGGETAEGELNLSTPPYPRSQMEAEGPGSGTRRLEEPATHVGGEGPEGPVRTHQIGDVRGQGSVQ